MQTPYATELIPHIFPGGGWGNGYVTVPKNHPYYGVVYSDVPVDVHGGLTYGERCDYGWEFGFDTKHSTDTLADWPEERVRAETERLRIQLEALAKPKQQTKEVVLPTQFYSVLAPGTKLQSTDVYCGPLERWLRPVEVKLATKEEQQQ